MPRTPPGCWADELEQGVIETARLRLRPFREDDKAVFAGLLNTPGMMAHLGGVKPRAETDASVDKRLADQARDGFSYWAMEARGVGGVIGSCGIRRGLNYPGTPVEGLHELGWRVAEAYWGKGYAREAAEATLAWSWANIRTDVIAAWTTIGNTRSWGLMERLGMTRRPDLDFRHQAHAADDPDGALIVYTLDRPR